MTILHTKKIWQGKLMNQRRENPSDSRSNLTESSHQSVIIWWVPKSTRLTTDLFSKRGSDLFVMCHILVLSVLPEVGHSCQDDFTKNWRSQKFCKSVKQIPDTSRTSQNSPHLRQWKGRTKYRCFQTRVHPMTSPKNVMLSSPKSQSISTKKWIPSLGESWPSSSEKSCQMVAPYHAGSERQLHLGYQTWFASALGNDSLVATKLMAS